MKKTIIASAILSLACMSMTAYANLETPQTNGGFSGPSAVRNIATVEQARNMQDDAYVTLRGHIIEQTRPNYYTFQDETGSITVEIGDRRWAGQTVTPQDLVEIYGEVDRDRDSIEIDVKDLRIVQP